jgi:hypothetical protein
MKTAKTHPEHRTHPALTVGLLPWRGAVADPETWRGIPPYRGGHPTAPGM